MRAHRKPEQPPLRSNEPQHAQHGHPLAAGIRGGGRRHRGALRLISGRIAFVGGALRWLLPVFLGSRPKDFFEDFGCLSQEGADFLG